MILYVDDDNDDDREILYKDLSKIIFDFFDEIKENRRHHNNNDLKTRKQLVSSSLNTIVREERQERGEDLLIDIDLKREHLLNVIYMYEYYTSVLSQTTSSPILITVKPESNFIVDLFEQNNRQIETPTRPTTRQKHAKSNKTFHIRFRVNFNLNELKQIGEKEMQINKLASSTSTSLVKIEKFSLNINLKINV